MAMSLLYSVEHALSHFTAIAQRLDKCYLMLQRRTLHLPKRC
jgi:hypothetical protein